MLRKGDEKRERGDDGEAQDQKREDSDETTLW